MDKKIQDLREHYSLQKLDESDLLENPINQFQAWFSNAMDSNILEPNAMTLSTSKDGRVKSRIVLLKEIDKEGFIFYTNYQSDKGQEIAQNKYVALNFLWKEIQRQVRIEGIASKITEERSTAYAQSRPRGSQIAAWVSNQSEAIIDRSIIEKKQAELIEQFKDQDEIPKPPHWGGYIVRPDVIEFWQGRPSRLHDRLRYRLNEKNEWTIDRLAP